MTSDYESDIYKHEYTGTRLSEPGPAYRRLFKRDKGRCIFCGRDYCLTQHHLQMRSRGGPNSINNIVIVCALCHAIIHRYRYDIVISKLYENKYITKPLPPFKGDMVMYNLQKRKSLNDSVMISHIIDYGSRAIDYIKRKIDEHRTSTPIDIDYEYERIVDLIQSQKEWPH